MMQCKLHSFLSIDFQDEIKDNYIAIQTKLRFTCRDGDDINPLQIADLPAKKGDGG